MQKLKINPVIYTQRLTLRTIEEKDKANMLALLTNTEIAQTFMLPAFQTQEEAVPLFEKLKTLSKKDGRFVYGICLQEELIGFINDVEIEQRRVELGYVIHPNYKNQGFATEALKAAIDALFRAGISVVQAGAFEENTASMRVMEKSGMIRTGKEENIEYRNKLYRCFYYQKEKKSNF